MDDIKIGDRRIPKHSISTQFSILFAVMGIIWATGAAYQRLVVVESWKGSIEDRVVEVKELQRVQQELIGKINQLESKIEVLLVSERSKVEHEIKTERAFTRSLCVALSHTQEQVNIPVTNDCDRP